MSPQKKKRAPAKQRIVLVDDHRIVLDGYKLMLDAEPDLSVCATATGAPAALDIIVREQPDLVVTDLTLAGRGGLDLIKDLIAMHPGLKILVCSMHDETLYAERALRAGAKGYVMKDSDGPTFLTAIRRVLSGQLYRREKLDARGSMLCGRRRGAAIRRSQNSAPGVRGVRLFVKARWRRNCAQLNPALRRFGHATHQGELDRQSAEMIRQPTLRGDEANGRRRRRSLCHFLLERGANLL